MPTYQEKIQALTDQQVLSILDSLSAELAPQNTPETKSEQAQLLTNVFEQAGQAIDLSGLNQPDQVPEQQTAQAARELLLLFSQVPEAQASLDEWLDHPPVQEAAGLPLILAAPVVFTGCIIMLNIAGHIHFSRHKDGTWNLEYDPTQKSPLDNTMKDMIKTLADLMTLLKP